MSDNNQQPYQPNHVPLSHRWGYGLSSLAILAYGSYGLWVDDIFIPGKRGNGLHVHGLEAWLVFAAMLCMVANFIAVIIDHFDQRNNETNYRRFAKLSAYGGWTFLAAAIVAHLLFTLKVAG